jgi:hypothetical protein
MPVTAFEVDPRPCESMNLTGITIADQHSPLIPTALLPWPATMPDTCVPCPSGVVARHALGGTLGSGQDLDRAEQPR